MVIESIRKVKISKKILAINLNFQRKILIVKKKKIIRIKRNLKMKQNTSDNTKVQSEKIPVIIKKKSTNIINNGRLCIVHAPCESN